MMKNILTIVAVVFISYYSQAQLNLDSLKLELERTYIQVISSNDWNAYTIKYVDKDSLVRHVIPFSKERRIEESINGIALSSYSYDDQQREIERRYYNLKGNLYFSDWPPIIKIEYNKQGLISKKKYFGEDTLPVKSFAAIEYDYNENGDLIEDRMLDAKYELKGERCVTRYEYDEEKGVVKITNFNSKYEASVIESKEPVIYKYDFKNHKRLEKVKVIKPRLTNLNGMVLVDSLYKELEKDSSIFCSFTKKFSIQNETFYPCGLQESIKLDYLVDEIKLQILKTPINTFSKPFKTSSGIFIIQPLSIVGDIVRFRSLVITDN